MSSVVRITKGVKRRLTGSEGDGTVRVDARSERWREHRIKVRQELVEAAVRVLDKNGPEVSMDDIAREAGAAKPKLYRHFDDKLDLYLAIVDHIQHMLFDRILSSINIMTDSTSELVARSVAEYAMVVSEHPNVFHFLVHSHFTQQADESERAIQAAKVSASRFASLFADAMDNPGVDADSVELVAYSIGGAAASATDWWLGANKLLGHQMPVADFVRYLTEIIRSMLDASARISGVTIDPDQPLHLAFSPASVEG